MITNMITEARQVASFVRMTTRRLARRVRNDFDAGSAVAVLDALADLAGTATDGAHASERVHGAIVLLAGGDITRFHEARDLAVADWRDVLVAAGLADADWSARLDAELGS
jgi:hypothetical protein